MKKVTLNVSGMTCGHCEKAVKGALLAVEGVENVDVELKTGKVEVQAEDKVSEQALKNAVEEQGYDVA